jgi:hypothetical protein
MVTVPPLGVVFFKSEAEREARVAEGEPEAGASEEEPEPHAGEAAPRGRRRPRRAAPGPPRKKKSPKAPAA